MESSEVRQKFEAWYRAQPRCLGFPKCDGDLVGLQHSNGCPLEEIDDSGGCSTMTTPFDCYLAGMRAGEIARWIPVEEKLPEKSGEYLVVESGDTEASSADFFIDLPNVEKSRWMTVRNFGQDCEERELFNVTHWQPLPAAPEEKKP